MGGRIIGNVEQIITQLGIQGGRIRKAVNDQIAEEAQAIRQISQAMVPEEFGHMKGAIKIESKSQRRLWVIYIDQDAAADGPKRGEMSGKYTVGDYLTFLHEGFYELGPISKTKQGEHTVGRKFMERAFAHQMQDGAIRRITAAARKAGVL